VAPLPSPIETTGFGAAKGERATAKATHPFAKSAKGWATRRFTNRSGLSDRIWMSEGEQARQKTQQIPYGMTTENWQRQRQKQLRVLRFAKDNDLKATTMTTAAATAKASNSKSKQMQSEQTQKQANAKASKCKSKQMQKQATANAKGATTIPRRPF
jgi:hypothetical protein